MKRLQIVCTGASSVYGVGGTRGGWVEMLKEDLHQKMYGPEGIGEMHEVYNLAVPGAVIADLAERTVVELKTIRKPGRTLVTVAQLGANNAKAVGTPDNFVSTPEQYEQEATAILRTIKELSDDVICLGMRPMDQAKVMPLLKDKEKGTKVYFPNDRIALFEKSLAKVAKSLDITFIPLFDETLQDDPDGKRRWVDGIHPNDEGYRQMYLKIKEALAAHLGS